MAHNSYSVDIVQNSSDVISGAYSCDLQWVVVFVLSQKSLHRRIVKFAIICQGDKFNEGACFSPGEDIGVVLKDGHQDEWSLTPHSIRLVEEFQISLMDCGKWVLFILAMGFHDGFAKNAIIRTPSVLFAEVNIIRISGYRLFIFWLLQLFNFFTYFFDAQLAY